MPPSTRFADLRHAFTDALQHKQAAKVSSSSKGVAGGSNGTSPESSSAATAGMVPLRNASPEALLVLGGCQSLVLVDDKVAGDPLEVASFKGIRWELLPNSSDACRPRPEALIDGPLTLSAENGKKVDITQLRVVSRHHFSSKLQRMSVVAAVPGLDGGFALVKGSPEVLQSMCVDVPEDYLQVAAELALRGMRVIAIGYRRLTSSQMRSCTESRAETEAGLRFLGFVSFTCRVRKDSADIIRQLRDGGCNVIMATGDAILTGIHVAREVGITTEGKNSIKILEKDDSGFWWRDYQTEVKEPASMDGESIVKMASRSDLCAVGSVISAALDLHPALSRYLHVFVVFARMRPDEKERVILGMKDSGRCTLMMGDGANDVGALKQSHVGIALLSGFGDLNSSKTIASDANDAKATAKGAVSDPEELYNCIVIKETDDELFRLPINELHRRMRMIGVEPSDFPLARDQAALVRVYKERAKVVAEQKKDFLRKIKFSKLSPQEQKAEVAREQKEMALKKQEEFKAEYDRLVAAGESWAVFKATRNIYNRTNEEMRQRREKEGGFEASAGKMASMMEGLEAMEDPSMPSIKIGDASGMGTLIDDFSITKNSCIAVHIKNAFDQKCGRHYTTGALHSSYHHPDVSDSRPELPYFCILLVRSAFGWNQIW